MKLKRIILFIILSILLVFSQAYATVSSSTSRIKHNCNGILTGFTFTFGINETEEVEVIHTDAGGTETTLTETTDYAISCTNNDCSAGGTCTTVDTYASGEYITILRNVPLTQESDFTENMATLYETFENELDKSRRIDQQLQEQIDRTIKFSKSTDYTANDYTFPDPDGGKIIGWNAGGGDLTTYSTSGGDTIDIASSIVIIGDYSNNIATAVTAIGASEKTILIDVATSGDTTIPSNINLWFVRGGSLTGTATIYSPRNVIASPAQHIFAVASSIKWTTGGSIYPEWWGENISPGTTDMTAEIQAAMDSGDYAGNSSYASKVMFLGKTYLTGTLTPPTQIHLQGSHQTRTILKLKAGTDDHLLDCNTSVNLNISDMMLDGNKANNATTSNGIDMNNCVSCSIERVYTKEFNDYGIYLDTCNDISIRRSWITENKYGFYSDTGEQCNLMECVIQNNETYGVQYVSALVGSVSTVHGNWFETSTASGHTPTDYIIIDSDDIYISANKFNVSNVTNSAVRFKTGASHNYIIANSIHMAGPTYYIVFDSGATRNFSIGTRGGDGGTVGGGTTDNDGENYILETDSTHGAFLAQAGRIYHNIITLANDATPSVKKGNYFLTGGTTGITDFDDGQEGQIITIVAEHTLIITDGTNIFLAGSANWNTMQATDTLTLICKADLKWYELSRSDN